MLTATNILIYFVCGIASIIWLYCAVRMATRAVIRTLDERRKNNG